MEIAIIGCTHAGTAAAQAIMAAYPEHHVTIFERHDEISFLACGVALYLDGTVNDLKHLHYQTPQALRAQGATVWLHHDVTRVDIAAHLIAARDMVSGKPQQLHYDKLIIATGARHSLPPMTGADRSRVLFCKDMQEAEAIQQTATDAQTVALVGGGYVGVELAESYAQTGHLVTIYEAGDQLLRNYLDAAGAGIVMARLADHGVVVNLRDPVRVFSDAPGQIGVRARSGEAAFDLAVATTGFTPATGLVATQLTCDRHGALVCDEYGRTSDADVYAAGDCRTSLINPTGATGYVPLASGAIHQGGLVGLNACGAAQLDYGTQATSAISVFGLCVATTGVTLAHAQRVVGLRPQAVTFRGTWRPAFMPRTAALTITLVYDRLTRRILGAQLFCEHEVAQSANALSIAIQNNNTIDDLAVVDMLFSPHYNEPNNYLNQVAQLAVAQERPTGQPPRFTALGAAGRRS